MSTKPLTSPGLHAKDAFFFILFSIGTFFIVSPSPKVATYAVLSIIGLFVVFTPIVVGGYGLHRLRKRLQ